MCSVCPDVFGLIHGVAQKLLTRIALGIAALALLLLPATASARELRVCADPNNLPFSNAAGQGFENRIAEIIADDLGAKLTYTWWAQRRGFVRNTLKAGLCDLVPGTPANLEMLRTTTPYYRSSYVFLTRQDGQDVTSFNDPRLATTVPTRLLSGRLAAAASSGISSATPSMATTPLPIRRRASSMRWRAARSISQWYGGRLPAISPRSRRCRCASRRSRRA